MVLRKVKLIESEVSNFKAKLISAYKAHVDAITNIPENILGQLGNRVQHALRAFTPKDQKAVKTAADTFRTNPNFKTDEAIMELQTGEALVSFLDEKGAPSVVERAKVLFPLSQIGAVTEGQRLDIIKQSRIYGKYDKSIDRESAFEVLMAEAEKAFQVAEREKQEQERQVKEAKEAAEKAKEEVKKSKKKGWLSTFFGAIIGAIVSAFGRVIGNSVGKAVTGGSSKKSSTGGVGSVVKSATESAVRSGTRSAITKITRDILGNLIK